MEKKKDFDENDNRQGFYIYIYIYIFFLHASKQGIKSSVPFQIRRDSVNSTTGVPNPRKETKDELNLQRFLVGPQQVLAEWK